MANKLRAYGATAPDGFDLNAVPSSDIALYFPDTPHKLYQLLQWLPVFEANTELRTIVVVRSTEAYNHLQGRTSLRVLLVPRYEAMMAMYDRADFHAVVYVNNGWTNFQSLSFQQAVHIHVNHGESDKICMVSNQAKAYDKVFVAGEAAVDLVEAVNTLARRGFQRIHSEGGPRLLGDLLRADVVDELCLTLAPHLVGGRHKRIVEADDLRVSLVPHVLLHADGDLIGRWLVSR